MLESCLLWRENLGEKSGEKEVLMGVYLGRRVKKIWWGPNIFSLVPLKSFIFRMERKLSGEDH